MATVTINGTNYTFPAEGDLEWGSNVSDWAAAVSQHLLQKTGGVFTLSADVDFGSSKGLLAPYYKSKAANISTAGTVRLGNTESVGWRNAANSANLLLSVNGSNELTFNGTSIATSAGLVPVASGGTAISSYTAGDTLYASGATTLTKLAVGAANRVMTSSGTAPQWGLLANANIDAAAAIALTKLATVTASRLLVSDGSGNISASSVTATEAGYLSGVTSAIQTQIDLRQESARTIFSYTSGSGTYTRSSSNVWLIRVRLVGGGGGGGASGTASWGVATGGGNTTFGSSLLTAVGGYAGGQSAGANGGAPTVNSPATSPIALTGGSGGGASFQPGGSGFQGPGGFGGQSYFGGAGGGGYYGAAGLSAVTNSGSGGGGGGMGSSAGTYSGSGGGAGAYIEAYILNPGSSYSYAVGAAGNGGSAGTNGYAGGAGAAGLVVIEEFY